MRFRGKMNSFLGLLAGGLLSLFGRTPAKPGLDDLKRADFPTSTQRLGISFGEKIRDVFRFKWLKAMYVANLVVSGPIGVGIIFAPETMMSLFETPGVDPVLFGYSGAVPLGFAICGALGLRSPLRMSPVLLLQAAYKAAYLLGVLLPLAVVGQFPASAAPEVVIFTLFIVGDLIAVPIPYLMARD